MATVAKASFAFLLLFSLLQTALVRAHPVGGDDLSSELESDGTPHGPSSPLLRLPASKSCDQTYGMMFCATSVVGNLVIIGGLMYLSARCISSGNELLIRMLGPGVVGGFLLPVLDALPESLIILVSGLSGSREIVQHKVLIGTGMLSGSTIMLLTLLWGSCVFVGRVNFAEYSTTTSFSPTGSGVAADLATGYAARIMVMSLIPLIIVQVPKVFHLSSGSRIAVSTSLAISLAFLLCYCLYQVFQPWIQRRRLEYAKHNHVISGLLRLLNRESLGNLVNRDGETNLDLIQRLFDKIDSNSDCVISASELRAFLLGIQFVGIELDPENAVEEVIKEFDTSSDKVIDKTEFVEGISEWIVKANHAITSQGPSVKSVPSNYYEKTRAEYDRLLDKSDNNVENVHNSSWAIVKALLLLLLGTLIAAFFADPLVDAVIEFSQATSIPSFYVSFIAMPLATNFSEAVTAIKFAMLKKQKSTSLAFSEIYGRVTMNNTLCLSVFLALVYIRRLSWDFSAETLVILVVSSVIGIPASFYSKFPLWTSGVACLLYPVSLVLVYLLDNLFGWS
ncbi:sodium/calcium exchanger NCL1-like [Aristolochia californica]|uniref:sodium/calcium exchanger NCL1-like n=1 Tax=Aristolochia californica TaxID=171875 RepID=UPI0035D9F0EE